MTRVQVHTSGLFFRDCNLPAFRHFFITDDLTVNKAVNRSHLTHRQDNRIYFSLCFYKYIACLNSMPGFVVVSFPLAVCRGKINCYIMSLD
uniref:Uncharacterized protein n=1 Tax=Denticeps clupeoides TaxID=299321 RepID=A0AAY4BNX0_9TELE